MDSPAGFPQVPPEGSPGLRRQKPDARNQTFDQFHTARVQNWVFDEISKLFCMVLRGGAQKTMFSIKNNIFNEKIDLDPNISEKSGKNLFDRAPLKGP